METGRVWADLQNAELSEQIVSGRSESKINERWPVRDQKHSEWAFVYALTHGLLPPVVLHQLWVMCLFVRTATEL